MTFGETLVDEYINSFNSPFKFNGKKYDEETGNYYYSARYYDPKLSIFISVDPLAEKYPSWSPYNFCMNNPIYFIDPDEREVKKPPLRGTKEFNSFVKDIVNKNSSSVNWSYKDGTWRYDAKKQSWIRIDETKGNNISFSPYKTSTTHKIIKSGVVLANAYSVYNEVVAGVGALLAPEPTGVAKAIGLYGIADGATRILSSPLALYGTITENEMLENAPSNVLGLVGNIIDNINSPTESYTTGGSVQFWGELTGDFGLSRRNLINTLEKEATTNMDKIIKGGKIVKGCLFLPVNGTIKSKKLQENE
ncbi:RHS repeat-associated core domain-containing protein [Flavobacterium sp. RNTU_13]|uniref:RHS repeat-associated core domain-containing protein n=1 Tax=Flavobacterium sp. RNTU_13 TaxID=3375145 RepID=UPI0039889105